MLVEEVEVSENSFGHPLCLQLSDRKTQVMDLIVSVDLPSLDLFLDGFHLPSFGPML